MRNVRKELQPQEALAAPLLTEMQDAGLEEEHRQRSQAQETGMDSTEPQAVDQDKRLRPKRPYRTYSPVERMGIMWLAMRDGLTEVSRREGVPKRTIEDWFKRYRITYGELRGWLERQVGESYLKAENAVYNEVVKRVRSGKMGQDELMMTFRKFIEARSAPPPATGPPAAALARQELHIHVDD